VEDILRTIPAALVFLLIATGPSIAGKSIGSITYLQITCNKVTIGATLNWPWKLAPQSNGDAYQLYEPSNQGQGPMIAMSKSPYFVVSNLQSFSSHSYLVEARVRRYWWFIPSWHHVDQKTVVTLPQCLSGLPGSGLVRLRHKQSNHCLFGDAVDGWPVKTWQCADDYAMLVALDSLGGGDVRIRIVSTGKCLYGNPVNGGEVKSWVCWNDPNMVWAMDTLGPSSVRFRHKNTGQCMYAGPANGEPVKNWPCWNDPNMIWNIEK
jgi:hypothetical protein